MTDSRLTWSGNQRGFTLVEMAIVLIIIGIILGAVLKGQDLISSARAKKVAATANTWNVLTYAYMDRMGRFPGDVGRDGIIGNTAAEQVVAAQAIGELSAAGVMANAPENPVVVGGQTFWVYVGSDASGAATGKNVMVICKDVACANLLTNDEMQILQSVDTALDGRADAGMGQFRAATTVTLTNQGVINNRATAAVTDVVAQNETTAGVTAVWNIATHRAAVWAFDRPY